MRGLFVISTAIAVAVSGLSRKELLPMLARHSGGGMPVPAAVIAPTLDQKGSPLNLVVALDGYERQPNADRAVMVWEEFSAVDAQLKSLKELVTRCAGGARAEAEIDRLELQRLRDEQMSRFGRLQRRFNSALAAFNALSNSVSNGEGIQDAASRLVHGRSRGDSRDPARAD